MSTAKKTNPSKWKRIVAAVKAGTKGGRAGNGVLGKRKLLLLGIRSLEAVTKDLRKLLTA
jgi:hypothetical protein